MNSAMPCTVLDTIPEHSSGRPAVTEFRTGESITLGGVRQAADDYTAGLAWFEMRIGDTAHCNSDGNLEGFPFVMGWFEIGLDLLWNPLRTLPKVHASDSHKPRPSLVVSASMPPAPRPTGDAAVPHIALSRDQFVRQASRPQMAVQIGAARNDFATRLLERVVCWQIFPVSIFLTNNSPEFNECFRDLPIHHIYPAPSGPTENPSFVGGEEAARVSRFSASADLEAAA